MRRAALAAIVVLVVLALAGVASSVLAPNRGQSAGPVVDHIVLEIEGHQAGIFQGLSGMVAETEVVEHKEVGKDGKQYVTKIPGATEYGNITLRAGLIDQPFIMWYFEGLVPGKVGTARKDGSVVLQSAQDDALAKYEFRRAWPCGWTVDVDPSSPNGYVEEFKLCVEEWKKVDLHSPGGRVQ